LLFFIQLLLSHINNNHNNIRLRKEKLEDEQRESEKERNSQNASPAVESPVLNLSKNSKERSQTPELNERVDSPVSDQNMDNSLDIDDPSDMEVSDNSMHSESPASPPNLNNKVNYHQREFIRPPPSLTFPSTEILLRNIQELLKVVLENSIQQEQQLSFEKGELAQKKTLKTLTCLMQ